MLKRFRLSGTFFAQNAARLLLTLMSGPSAGSVVRKARSNEVLPGLPLAVGGDPG